MARKKTKRPNLPQETLERARAEMRGEVSSDSFPVPPSINGGEGISERPTLRSASGAAPAAAVKPRRTGGGASLTSRRIPSIQELLGEYAYVMHDLRNLLILAVVLLVIIIAASFLLARPIG